MVSETDISSKSKASQRVDATAFSAVGMICTNPRNVLIHQLLDIDFETVLDDVFFHIWITLVHTS